MGQADDAVSYASQQIGKPYVWATAGPDTFDCSGLVKAAYAHANPPIDLVHYTGAQVLQGVEVAQSELQPGDLVFPNIGHVQLFIGNGQVIEAANSAEPVEVSPLGTVWHARRVATDGKKSSVLDAAGGVLRDATGNVVNALGGGAVSDFVDLARTTTRTLKTTSNPDFWKRIGMGASGVFFILTGVFFLQRHRIAGVAGSAVGAVGSLAGTVAQGAAFGVGAARGGGGGGAQPVGFGAAQQAIEGAGRPLPAPRPIEHAPVSATPVTAPLPEFDRPPARTEARPVPRTTRRSSVPGRFVDYGPVGRHRMYDPAERNE